MIELIAASGDFSIGSVALAPFTGLAPCLVDELVEFLLEDSESSRILFGLHLAEQRVDLVVDPAG